MPPADSLIAARIEFLFDVIKLFVEFGIISTQKIIVKALKRPLCHHFADNHQVIRSAILIRRFEHFTKLASVKTSHVLRVQSLNCVISFFLF